MLAFSLLCCLVISFSQFLPSNGQYECGQYMQTYFDSLGLATPPIRSYTCAAQSELSGETYGPLKDCTQELSDTYSTFETMVGKFNIPKEYYCNTILVVFQFVNIKYYLQDPANALVLSAAKTALRANLIPHQDEIFNGIISMVNAIRHGEELLTAFNSLPANAETYPQLAVIYNDLLTQCPEYQAKIKEIVAFLINCLQPSSASILQFQQEYPALAASYDALASFVQSVLPASVLDLLQVKLSELYGTIVKMAFQGRKSQARLSAIVQSITKKEPKQYPQIEETAAQLPKTASISTRQSIISALQSFGAQHPQYANDAQTIINQISNVNYPNIVKSLQAIAAQYPQYSTQVNDIIAQLPQIIGTP